MFDDQLNIRDNRLCRFDVDVARKAIGDDDVSMPFDRLLRLDVADEVETALRKKREGIPQHHRPFLFLFPVRQKPYPRIGDAENFLGVDYPHVRELQEIFRLGIGGGAHIEEDRRLQRQRIYRRQGRTANSGDAPQIENRCRETGDGVAGGDKGVGLIVLHHAHAHANGRILLVPYLLGVIGHREHIGCVDQADVEALDIVLCQFRTGALLRPHEDDFVL